MALSKMKTINLPIQDKANFLKECESKVEDVEMGLFYIEPSRLEKMFAPHLARFGRDSLYEALESLKPLV